MKRFPFVFWMVLLLFLINSCNLDSLDMNKLSKEVNLNPALVAPVVKANISVWDLIQSANTGNEDVLTKDPVTGLIKIVYRQNDLFTYNVRDFLKFPSQQAFSSGDKQLGEISPANVSISKNITLNDLVNNTNGALDEIVPLNGTNSNFPAASYNGPDSQYSLNSITDFRTISLSKGTLEINLDNKLKVPVTITGSLYDIGFNRKITNFTFANINPDATSKTSVSLAGVQMSSQIEFRMSTFQTPGSSTPVYIDLADYFNISFDLVNLGISNGNLKVTAQTLEGYSGVFGFTFPEPDLKAFKAVLKKGSLLIKTTNSSKLTGAINFSLDEIKRNGVPVIASIPLSGNSTTIDLSGTEINFSSDQAQPYNQIPYTFSLQVNGSNGYIDYASTDAIKMDITLNGLEFKSIHGDFGKRLIEIDPGNFDMNVDLLNKIDGGFKLANPKLELILHNSIGMPGTINLDFTASNKDGKTAPLSPPAFDIPVPANISAGAATKSIVFDKSNSNIVNFIALPPTGQISYSGKVDFNKTTPVTLLNPNFLDVDATFGIDMVMELPMELQISNLAFKDTSAITGSDYEKLESADLIVNSTNGIPLDIDMQLFFIDTLQNTQLGSSKKTKILTAAQVNSSGAITPVKATQTFSLDSSEMVNLRKANGIVFSGTVSSPSGGAGVATILSDSKLELNVVIKAKVNL
ncbi:MAG: hypothetical protein Q8N05_12480 [Bacteroidota bacterium]|nr:hypothetical protein [Bacteroidota bacterium]